MRPSRPLAALAAIFAINALALPGPPDWPVWLAAALVATILTVPLSLVEVRRAGSWMVIAAVALAVVYQLDEQVRQLQSLFPRESPARLHRVALVLTGLGLVAILPLSGRMRAIPLAALVALLALFSVLSIADLRHGPPDIDVYEMHREALARFGRGESPYSGTFRNIYPHTDWYGPGLVVDGRVQIGFAYPPLSFLFALAGDLFGDYRVGYLAATLLATIAFASIGGTSARAAAVLYLLYARHLYVIHQSWTEPVFVLGLAVVLWAATRRPRALPVALGLFWATKQYAALLLPLLPLLLPGYSWRERGRIVIQSFLVAAVLYVPFLVWDPVGFFRSVVMYQIWQPFRMDSIGFLSWWAWRGHEAPGNAVTFGALALGLAAALALAHRSALGFCAGSALALLLFFAFAKQAFLNYYYCCVGILVGVVATSFRKQA